MLIWFCITTSWIYWLIDYTQSPNLERSLYCMSLIWRDLYTAQTVTKHKENIKLDNSFHKIGIKLKPMHFHMHCWEYTSCCSVPVMFTVAFPQLQQRISRHEHLQPRVAPSSWLWRGLPKKNKIQWSDVWWPSDWAIESMCIG